jgi:hypothetical protein
MRPWGRLLVAAVVAASVVGGGLFMERRLAASPPATRPAPPVSGAWYCPHGGGEGWRAWVVVANPTDVSADVRLTSRTGSGAPQAGGGQVPPQAHTYFEVPATAMASATVVEFFGTSVAAGMVTARPDGEGGVGAEPCADRPATTWFVSEAATVRGHEANVVVHNPFASEAVVDVTLFTAERPIRHGRLQGLVLEPGQVDAVPVGEFALGQRGIAVSVRALIGRVVASGIHVSPAGVRSVVGVPEGTSGWILPGAGDPATGRLVVAAPEGQAAFRADAQAEDAQTPLVDLESVPAGSAAAFDLAPEGGGVLVRAEGAEPVLAGRLLVPPQPEPAAPRQDRERRDRPGQGERPGDRGGRDEQKKEEPPEPEPGDLAATAGAGAPGSRWLVLPATAPEGGPAALVLQNPGGAAAEVTVTLLGPAGPEGEPQQASVLPGTTIRIDLPATPVAALVEATEGGVVPAQASLDRRIYAVSVGVPIP